MNKTLFLLIATALFIASCDNGKLTAGKAEKLLLESGRFPQPQSIELEYGIVGYQYDSLPAEYYKIKDQGAIKIEPLGKSGLFTISYVFKVDLTDKGKSFLIEEDKHPTRQGDKGYLYTSRFKTCDENFEKVESVYEIPAFNEAEVSYIAKRENFTPFWYKHYDKSRNTITEDTVVRRKASLFKTDKGWSTKK